MGHQRQVFGGNRPGCHSSEARPREQTRLTRLAPPAQHSPHHRPMTRALSSTATGSEPCVRCIPRAFATQAPTTRTESADTELSSSTRCTQPRSSTDTAPRPGAALRRRPADQSGVSQRHRRVVPPSWTTARLFAPARISWAGRFPPSFWQGCRCGDRPPARPMVRSQCRHAVVTRVRRQRDWDEGTAGEALQSQSSRCITKLGPGDTAPGVDRHPHIGK